MHKDSMLGTYGVEAPSPGAAKGKERGSPTPKVPVPPSQTYCTKRAAGKCPTRGLCTAVPPTTAPTVPSWAELAGYPLRRAIPPAVALTTRDTAPGCSRLKAAH